MIFVFKDHCFRTGARSPQPVDQSQPAWGLCFMAHLLTVVSERAVPTEARDGQHAAASQAPSRLVLRREPVVLCC